MQDGSSGSVTAAITIALLVSLGWLTDRGRSMMLARRQRQREASRDVETPDGKRERSNSEGGEETELVGFKFNNLLIRIFLFFPLKCQVSFHLKFIRPNFFSRRFLSKSYRNFPTKSIQVFSL